MHNTLPQVGYGGAYQYSVWNDAPNIFGFYTNRTVIDWYLNAVETVVTRVNSITGVAYRDDPAIFAWDLINEPHVPGDDSGDILTVSQLSGAFASEALSEAPPLWRERKYICGTSE